MMVIMLAMSWGAVFICWLELHIPWSVSGSAPSDADRLWFIGSPAAWHQSRLVSDQTYSQPAGRSTLLEQPTGWQKEGRCVSLAFSTLY